MIVVKINGRLGHQLTSYMSGRALAKHLNTDLFVDISKARYGYYLEDLGFSPKIITNYNLRIDKQSMQSHIYSSKFFNKKDNIVLSGTWCHHKYYKNVINDLRKEIRDVEGIPPSAVGIHVRRGDFVKLKNRIHTTREYIVEAARIFSGRYFMFTDDLEWCVKNLSDIKPERIYSTDPVSDFLRLKQCERLIISTSSFSYLAAIFSGCPTIAPKKWFVAGRPADHCPPNWIKV